MAGWFWQVHSKTTRIYEEKELHKYKFSVINSVLAHSNRSQVVHEISVRYIFINGLNEFGRAFAPFFACSTARMKCVTVVTATPARRSVFHSSKTCSCSVIERKLQSFRNHHFHHFQSRFCTMPQNVRTWRTKERLQYFPFATILISDEITGENNDMTSRVAVILLQLHGCLDHVARVHRPSACGRQWKVYQHLRIILDLLNEKPRPRLLPLIWCGLVSTGKDKFVQSTDRILLLVQEAVSS